jgi:hypothetical protein
MYIPVIKRIERDGLRIPEDGLLKLPCLSCPVAFPGQ